MYTTNDRVSEAALQRVHTRPEGAPLPTDFADYAPREALGGGAAPLVDLLHRLTPQEEVGKYYQSPPSSLRQQQQQTEKGGAAARKRAQSLHRAEGEGALAKKAKDDSAAAAAAGPTMDFVEGFQPTDYLGRSFLEPPPATVAQADTQRAVPCRLPGVLRGTYKGGQTAGVQEVRWAPPAYGHLLFTADLQGEARLWEGTAGRKLLATYRAHQQPIKSLEVTPTAHTLSTGSVDGTVALWDVEAGACRDVITNADRLPVTQHVHHPFDVDSLLLVAVNRRVVLYDVRASTSKHQKEYAGHLGTILNLTLLSGGSKFLTTAEDKTLRTWDFRIPVQIKQFADTTMHAISHVAPHPTEPFLAAQSFNNTIVVFKDEGAGKLRLVGNRTFAGHTISGTRCQLAFSRDGQYLSSGDISGQLFLWRWADSKLLRSFKAHTDLLASHAWHPLEPARVVTAAWDGSIKNWS